ncbi:MAG: cysteine--tRNA ligase [Clostridia bacterium]|nr:cysteine--tRNA ligase [Clostridia bacterium]MDD4375777.1 cysteine--tRNA ligase [Clostridia bacterium]
MLKIYNTLSRKKEEFKPLDDKEVRIYTCGPTVYYYAHIGNMRAYLFMDSLRKVLKLNGYTLKHVMNITDVGHMTSDADEGEDKMNKAAREQKLSPWDISKKYTDAFLFDCNKLNIELPEIIAKATEHILEMEDYVKRIEENGYSYETSKGVYFNTERLNSYGELSKANLKDNKAGARIAIDKEKKNPLDFALWIKAPKEHIMKWDSKWGVSYPGWHIECSAMAKKYLGEKFDIHTGGIDHIPIHHENEIAQSKGAYGTNPAKYWMHVEFLQVDGGKMSKSLKNDYRVSDIEERGYSSLALRYMSYTSHYRNKLNFTWDSLDSSQKSLVRLKEAYNEHNNGKESFDANKIEEYRAKFKEALNDDLNFPVALAITWELARTQKKSKQIANLLLEFDKILSLDIDKGTQITEESEFDLSLEIQELLNKRKEARKQKDFVLSDEIRDKLKEKGYIIIDSKEGQQVKKI